MIVDRPLGATGASMLIQLVITAFYDVNPGRREVTLYPEIYLFHVGGRHGNHAYYDVYPPRKEVVVANDSAEILEAINDRAITRLAVVDGPAEEVTHHWKEPAAALDRLVTAYAYDPSGRVGRGDLEIMATDRRALVNTSIILHPKVTYAEQQELGSRPATDRCRRTRSWSRRTTSATTCPRSCVTWSSGTAGTPTPTAPLVRPTAASRSRMHCGCCTSAARRRSTEATATRPSTGGELFRDGDHLRHSNAAAPLSRPLEANDAHDPEA